MASLKCPVCDVTTKNRICPKCGLGIPRGIEPVRYPRRPGPGQDFDVDAGHGSYYEAARHKADHSTEGGR